MSPIKLKHDLAIRGLADAKVGDFWAWAYSDILSNRNRSVFAEYIVGSALGVLEKPRVEWEETDLRYKGLTVEVKSAAYVQSWPQSKPSVIGFDIAKKLGWNSETNVYATLPVRPADCYVFCLYTEKDQAVADVLNISSWQFYVLPTSVVNTALGEQKSVRLSRIVALCPDPVCYQDLKPRVDAVLSRN